MSIWRIFLPVFPEYRVPHSWSPHRVSLRECYGSAAAMAHYLIHVEDDGKGQTSAHSNYDPQIPPSQKYSHLWNCMPLITSMPKKCSTPTHLSTHLSFRGVISHLNKSHFSFSISISFLNSFSDKNLPFRERMTWLSDWLCSNHP